MLDIMRYITIDPKQYNLRYVVPLWCRYIPIVIGDEATLYIKHDEVRDLTLEVG